MMDDLVIFLCLMLDWESISCDSDIPSPDEKPDSHGEQHDEGGHRHDDNDHHRALLARRQRHWKRQNTASAFRHKHGSALREEHHEGERTEQQ